MAASETDLPATPEAPQELSAVAVVAEYRRKGEVLGAFDPRTTEAVSLFYGPPDGPVGLLGYLFALRRAIAVDGKTPSAPGLAALIHKALPPETTSMAQREDLITRWLQPSRQVVTPDAALLPALREALVAVASIHGLGERMQQALTLPWPDPGALFLFLRATAAAPSRPAAVRAVDPEFLLRSQANDRPRQLLLIHRPFADEVGDILLGEVGRTNIVAIFGGPSSGKRAVVTEFLLKQLDWDQDTVEAGKGANLRPLKVFALARFPGLEATLAGLARFLGIAADQRDSAALLARIEQAARVTPALYVLCDFPLSEPFSLPLMQPELMERLLRGLFWEGTSRVLLTCAAQARALSAPAPAPGVPLDDDLDPSAILRTLPVAPRFMPQPSAGAVGDDLGIPAALIPEPAHRLDGCFVTLLESVWHLRTQPAASPEAIDQAVGHAFAASDCRQADMDWSQRDDLRSLVRVHYRSLPAGRSRRMMMALAFSDDGVRRSSMMRLLDIDGGDAAAVGGFDREFDALVAAIRGICVSTTKQGPWPEDSPPGEDGAEDLVELAPVVRRVYEAMLLVEEPVLARQTNWRIATLARRQGLWARHVGGERVGVMTPGIRRDAVALLRALMALGRLEPGDAAARGKDSGPPIDVEAEIFAGRAPPLRAFRYLYRDLFLRELDAGYRLSHRLALDDLRLTILLSFCNPGTPVYLDRRSDEVRLGAWPFIRKALAPGDQIELLNSLAVAARRARAWPVVRLAVKHAKALVDDRSHPACPASLGLVFRAGFDMQMLTCGAAEADSASPGSSDPDSASLDNLARALNLHLDRLAELHDAATPRVVGAMVKIRSRLAALLFSQGLPKEAREQFAVCEAADAAQWRQLDADKFSAGHAGGSFSGAGLRSYERLLLCLADSAEDAAARTALIAHARRLHDRQLQRLARHPRERALMLLDEARLRLAEGQRASAAVILVRMLGDADISGLTLASRLEFEAGRAECGILLLRHGEGALGEDGAAIAAIVGKALVRAHRIAASARFPIHAVRVGRLVRQVESLRPEVPLHGLAPRPRVIVDAEKIALRIGVKF